MTRDDIIKMAQKAKLLPIDIGPTVDTKYMRSKRESLQHFAELVATHTLSSIDPSKFMSYQEGYEAGVLNEREACIDLLKRMHERQGTRTLFSYYLYVANLIQTRGQS